jgi:hypothetical protein
MLNTQGVIMDKEDQIVVYFCILVVIFFLGYFTGAQV